MLQKLFINNYALIKELSVDFSDGFSVITGETGAGKSIIIGAIQLLMGARSSSKLLDDNSKKSIVEGVFKPTKFVDNQLKKLDLDCNTDLIIRREIKPNGSSRSFINDTPVKIDQLKIITQGLIELNGQHLVSNMSNIDFNYEFVNSFLNDNDILNEYKKSYFTYLKYKRLYQNLTNESAKLNEKKDFLSFQLEELSNSPIDQWDEDKINNEYNLIHNQKYINNNLTEVNDLFFSENGINNLLLKTDELFSKLNTHLKDLNPFIERFESVRIELQDIFEEIKNKYSIENSSPQRLQELDDLIKHINFLLKKFNVIDLKSLISKRDGIKYSISQINDIDNEINECLKKKNYWEDQCRNIGFKLLKAREANFTFIEDRVNDVLSSISMSHANFKLKLTELDHITANGIDHLELLISVNNKEEYYPITKFSSGGELSRIALAIKSVSANTKSIPVLIFDEIDSGISGKVASEVGLLLKNISKMAQVINITHLPQVAAFGNVHFHVEKNETLNGMSSNLTILNKEERIQVLANMLGGDKTGTAARNNALELLN